MSEDVASIEIPLFQSHKRVRALKISTIVEDHADPEKPVAVHVDQDFCPAAPIRETLEWLARFKGQGEDPGYWVRYEDGYTSWSPTEAFESGYTRVEGN